MANWKAVLHVKDVMKRAQTGSIPTDAVSKVFADELGKLPPDLVDMELTDIIYDFKQMSEHSETTDDEFNDVLESLYDWADRDHRLWIEPGF
jgi:hypothetical protein